MDPGNTARGKGSQTFNDCCRAGRGGWCRLPARSLPPSVSRHRAVAAHMRCRGFLRGHGLLRDASGAATVAPKAVRCFYFIWILCRYCEALCDTGLKPRASMVGPLVGSLHVVRPNWDNWDSCYLSAVVSTSTCSRRCLHSPCGFPFE